MLTFPEYEQRRHIRPRRVGFVFAVGWLILVTAGAASAARVLDLVTFTPPPGWNVEEKGAGLTQQVVMSRATTTIYCMVSVCASTPASGDLEASFAAEWRSVALQTIDAVPTPKTERRTIGDANALAGAAVSTIQRQSVRAELLVLDAGANVVSIFVLTPTAAAFDTFKAEVQTMFAGIKVRRVNAAPVTNAVNAGGGQPLVIPPPTRALTIADLAGEWGRNDGINTTYVDRYSGTYAGTDSLHFTEQWVITAKGEISLDFFAIRNGKKITEKSTGVVTLSGGILSIKMTNEQRYVLRGWLVTPNMTVMNLNGPWYEKIPPDILSNPEQGWNLDKKWVRLVKKE